MKKVMYLAAMMISLSSVAATPPELNEKVIKAFKQTFTEAENVSWSEMGNSNTYQANFRVSAVTVKAIYDDDGNLLQTMKYYDEKNLPSTILAKLKIKQAGKEIFGITEIANDYEVAFHIVLRDDKHWYWIKSDPLGNMEETKKLIRGEPRLSAF
jgi:hypothetical protein